MEQRTYAAILLVYITVIGSLNRSFKTDLNEIQNLLYYAGLGILTFLFFKHSDKTTFSNLPYKMAIYGLFVIAIIVYFAVSS